MFEVIDKQELNPDVTRLSVQAPQVAASCSAGQFVVVIVDEKGERIPLTIAGWDAEKGTVTLIFQKVGFTTRRLGALAPGDKIAHLLGPLGHPTQAQGYKDVVCVAGGVGVAEVLPVAAAFKAAGSNVTCVIGSRTKSLLILEQEIRAVSDKVFVTTDDGSYGRKGLVLDVLKELAKPDLVYAIGPVPMMQAVSEYTRGIGVKTTVSLNPIMVDATGMCGACRCTVNGKTKFGCVDGPDFDGHQIDFEDLRKRLSFFRAQEQEKR